MNLPPSHLLWFHTRREYFPARTLCRVRIPYGDDYPVTTFEWSVEPERDRCEVCAAVSMEFWSRKKTLNERRRQVRQIRNDRRRARKAARAA